jgi:hypothetical protein
MLRASTTISLEVDPLGNGMCESTLLNIVLSCVRCFRAARSLTDCQIAIPEAVITKMCSTIDRVLSTLMLIVKKEQVENVGVFVVFSHVGFSWHEMLGDTKVHYQVGPVDA